MSAVDQQWWPSPFGAEDQHGMLNHVTDAKRRDALSVVRHGRMYDLGRVVDDGVPVFPGRHFRQSLVSTAHHTNARSGGGLGDNQVNWVIEIVSATTQLGTHLDMLNHLQIGDRGYNGWTVAELAEPWGTNRLGADTAPQVVTRGWLVDAAAARGVESLGRGDVVTLEDVKRALGDRRPEPGDAVLFHTGWGRHWDSAETYLGGEPGPGMDLARWLADSGVALTGCDTWSYGPVPAEDPARPFEVPQTLNVRHGVFVVENLDTSALAADGVREFALVLTHPKLRGATGGWTSPIALV
ncbi:MAG TPA: cyclase family protein [Nocardioidaceae bacterium]|jgi:kynurenine formamidase